MKIKNILLCFILFLLVSCSNKSNEITYTNIGGPKSIAEVKRLLEDKLSPNALNMFLSDVTKYASIVPDLSDEFKPLDKKPDDYDIVKITDTLHQKDPNSLGNNCRITTFGLTKDFIELDSSKELGSNLFFDIDSLEESKKFDESDFLKFNTFYTNVKTEHTKDINVHLKNMKNYFKKINLDFNLLKDMSIISVIFHDDLEKDNDKLFVGHTGLLIKDMDDYYFIEKLSFELPYQMVKFKNKQQLNDYLMAIYDKSWGQETASPFIMENDELLKEYRILPNKDKKESA